MNRLLNLAKFIAPFATLSLTQKKVNALKELVLSGQFDKALIRLEKYIKRDPSPQAYAFKGAILSLRGDSNKAKENFILATRKDPKQPLWVKRAAGLPVYSAIHLEDWKVTYFPIPKCASSSIKSLFIKIETDQDLVFAHPHYENPFSQTQEYVDLISNEDYRFCIIREPIERFISYYQKNIVEGSILINETKRLGFNCSLNPKPSLEEFIHKLDEYIFAFDDVRHHVLPQYDYLADVLDDIDDFYTLNELNKLHAKLCSHLNQPLLLSHLMESATKKEKKHQNLSDDAINKLQAYYKKDYQYIYKNN